MTTVVDINGMWISDHHVPTQVLGGKVTIPIRDLFRRASTRQEFTAALRKEPKDASCRKTLSEWVDTWLVNNPDQLADLDPPIRDLVIDNVRSAIAGRQSKSDAFMQTLVNGNRG